MSLTIKELRVMVDTDNLEAVRAFYRELLDVPELSRTQQDKELAMIVFPLRHNDWGDTSFALREPAGCVLVFLHQMPASSLR